MTHIIGTAFDWLVSGFALEHIRRGCYIDLTALYHYARYVPASSNGLTSIFIFGIVLK
jgi:hypothetical protein